MAKQSNEKSGEAGHYIYCKYIVRNGVKVYPSRAKVFRFWVAA